MNPLAGLYVITDERLTPATTLVDQVEAAVSGGARIVQYRDKSPGRQRRLEEAGRLRELCHAAGACLIINDDVDLCLDSGADGVHLGLGDGDLADARRRLGPSAILGATCHGDPALAHRAIEHGADYVAFGRFFSSSTKPDAPPARLDTVSAALPSLGRPACAIGGITLGTAPVLIAAGFQLLAVVGDVFAAPDIEARCRAYTRLFGR